jgi:hypothetical protein
MHLAFSEMTGIDHDSQVRCLPPPTHLQHYALVASTTVPNGGCGGDTDDRQSSLSFSMNDCWLFLLLV